jgi:hypothetical protein
MPLLPTQDINTNAVDLGQGPSIARAGDVWSAVSQVGGKIQNFAAELAYKRKQAETSSYVNTSANDFERFISEKETEYQSQFPGDPTGYAAAMNESMNDWYEQRKESAPNNDAKDLWEQKFANFSQQAGMRADAWENQSRVKYQIGQIDESVRKDQIHLAQKPDTTKAAQFITNTSQMVNDGIGLWYDETEAKKRLNSYSADTVSSLFEGMEANKQYGAGLRLLEGKDPNSQILLNGMDPKQLANYKDRFTKLAQAESEVNKHTLAQKMNDLSTSFMQGISNNKTKAEYTSLMAQAQSLKPEDRAYFMDNLELSRQYGEQLNALKTLPLDEVSKHMNFSIDHGDEVFNRNSRVKMAEDFQKSAAKIVDQRRNQPTEFWVENDQSIRMLSMAAMSPENTQSMDEFAKRVTAKKIADKTNSPQILTPTMSKGYSTILKGGNPIAADGFRNSLKVGYGNNFGNVVNDMVTNGHITSDMAIAMHLEDEEARTSSFENIINKKAIESAYDTRSDKLKGEETDLFSDSKVIALKQAMIGNSGNAKDLWVTNGIDDLLKLEYKAGRVAGKDIETAKNDAVKKVISNNFDVATYGKSSIPLMGQYRNMRDDVEDFMAESSSTQILSQLNLKLPQSYSDWASKSEKTPQDAQSRYINELSQFGKWQLNPSQNGLRLVKANPNGKLTLPLDEGGNPIEVKFEDMKTFMTKTQKEDKKIKRVFDKVGATF